jgi:hypothetical protein
MAMARRAIPFRPLFNRWEFQNQNGQTTGMARWNCLFNRWEFDNGY